MPSSVAGRRRRIPAAVRVAAPLIAAIGLAWSAAAAAAQSLDGRIDTLLGVAKLGDATVGISVIDVDTGRVLAQRDADRPMIPASNMKLLTSGAALFVLGPEFVFRTEIAVDGDRLIVRGSGDPALGDPALLERMDPAVNVREMLDTMASGVRKVGVTRLREIVIDGRVFDRQLVHPGWPTDQLDSWYCAEVSGVNFHTNVLSFFPRPGRGGAGSPPTFSVEPDFFWADVEVQARTIDRDQNAISLTRSPGRNRFTLGGKVRYPLTKPVDVTLHEPGLVLGELLAVSLLKSGVEVGGVSISPGATPTVSEALDAARAVRAAADGEALPPGRIATVITTNLRDVLERCNGDSQNLYAEALIKRIGHDVTGEPGSWANGASVIRMTLAQKLGPDAASGTVASDGSGLSRDNRVSPRTLTRWIATLAQNEKVRDEFLGSLASAEHGKMADRIRKANLRCDMRAKSGSINGVRCLSGVLIEPTTGRRVAFSIMINDLKVDATRALSFHESVVRAIDEQLSPRAGQPKAVGGR